MADDDLSLREREAKGKADLLWQKVSRDSPRVFRSTQRPTKTKMVARLLPFLLATPGALGKKVSHDEAKCVMEGRSIARARAPRHAPPFF